MVDTTGVFVALDGSIDCLCSYPKRGRPPRGSRVTVRILGINNDSNRIWGSYNPYFSCKIIKEGVLCNTVNSAPLKNCAEKKDS